MLFRADSGFSQESATQSVAFPSPVIALTADPKTQTIFAASGNLLVKFDRNLNRLAQQSSDMDYVHDLALTGDQLIVAGGNPGEHGAIEAYSGDTLVRSQRRQIHSDSIHAIALNDESIFTASADHLCRRLEFGRLEIGLQFSEHSKRVTCLTLIPDSKLAISAGLDDTIRVWDIESGTLTRTLTHHQDDVLDIDVYKTAPNALPMLVSVSTDRTVRFWQPTIGRMVRFKSLEQTPTVCEWVAATPKVVIATDDGRVIEIDSSDLAVRQLADVKKPIFSLAILATQQIAIGTIDSLELMEYPGR
jgi:WD40 repeat protein